VSEYYELQRALLLARSLSGGAESHGILCGLLCGGATLGMQSWLDHVLGNEDPGCDTPQESLGLLAQIAEETVRAMDDPDAPFSLLLPDDDEPICERAAALVEWCEGFLFGFGMNGSADLAELSQEGREFVSDLKEISRMDVSSSEEDEENEGALNELVEYIKAGTLILREEVCAPKPGFPGRLH